MIDEQISGRRRGPAPRPDEEKRTHAVAVRFSSNELESLDKNRGRFQRAEFLRSAALGTLPPTIPPLNQQAWSELSRAAANLNQIAHALNAGSKPGGLQDQLAQFRAALIGAKLKDAAE